MRGDISDDNAHMVFHVLLLLAFLVPLLMRTMFWVGVNRLQTDAGPASEVLPHSLHRTACLAERCETLRVWQMVLRWDESPLTFALAVTLLIYNLLRGALFLSVQVPA